MDGRLHILAVRGRGNFIGETAMGTGGLPPSGWQFSLRARGDVTCKIISFEKFYDLAAKHPAFVADGRTGAPSQIFHAPLELISKHARLS